MLIPDQEEIFLIKIKMQGTGLVLLESKSLKLSQDIGVTCFVARSSQGLYTHQKYFTSMILTNLSKRTFRSAFYMLGLMVITIFSAIAPSPNQTANFIITKNDPSKRLNDSLTTLLNQLKQSFGVDKINLTIGVVKDGKVYLKKNYGYANPTTKTLFSDRTQIYLASTSKSLTGTLAAVLDQKGIIKLDGTLADYLPSFTFDDQNIKPNQITIRSLMTHTHGIKNNDFVVWTAFIGAKSNTQLMALLKKYSTALPNQNFSYSNLGPVLYALIVEQQLKKPWQQVMEEQVFRPLGMYATTAYVAKVNPKYISYVIDQSEGQQKAVFDKADNSMSAAGGHLSTVNDLLRYLQFFMSDGQSIPGILGKQALDLATSAIVPQQNQYQSYQRFGYGLGWEQAVFNGEQLTSRLGGYSGIASHLSFIKDKKIGIVVLSNSKGMEALPHLVANYIYNIMLGKTNTQNILKENLASLKRNFDADVQETKEITAAMQTKITMDQKLVGIYNGGEKSGPMEIRPTGSVSWGNLKGKLYLLSDSTGLINFSTMLRSFSVKREQGAIVGVYSNDRYFKR